MRMYQVSKPSTEESSKNPSQLENYINPYKPKFRANLNFDSKFDYDLEPLKTLRKQIRSLKDQQKEDLINQYRNRGK